MIPARYSHLLFGLILSGLMSLMVSGLSTAMSSGLADGFVLRWIVRAWLPSWAMAFPAVLIVAPLTRRMVAALTRP